VSLTRGRSAVWALNLVLAVAAAAIFLHVHDLAAPITELRVPWWMLAAAFAITEASAVHIHFRRGAHTLTLGELPLVMGLLLASPGDVMIGWVVGAAVVLTLNRSYVPVRFVFNLVQLAVTAGVAALILHALIGPGAQLGPAVWVAAGGAVLVAAAVSAVLVGAAMWLSGDPLRPGKVIEMVVMAVIVAGTNASLGLAGGTVIGTDPRGAALLIAPVLVVFLAYRAYTAHLVQHTNLEFLFQASRTLSNAPDPIPGMAGLLALGLETFRAEVAEVCLFPASREAAGSRLVVGAAGRPEGMQPLDAPVARELRELVERDPAARLITPDDVGEALAGHLRRLGVQRAMIAGLPGERRRIGTLLIANRFSASVPFSSDDLKLFETLAHQTGAALGQDRLSRALNELSELQAGLEHQAFHDPLTSLANRLLFMNRVDHALKRRGGNAAVLYIDLDDFKTINDTLGHEAGDELLLAAADRLRDSLRPADTPARLGGDEFAVLLLDISEEHVRIVADRILRKLGAPLDIEGRERGIEASLGVAMAESGSLGGAELVRNADVAMYVSKHGGKRGYSVYDPRMSPPPSAADRVPAQAEVDAELASLAG
jgi:diguanylate cyclase (GGDEF)-like protein